MKPENKLSEVAKIFFKLGCFAFGGPAVHIAMMEEEVVTKRKWMTREHYLDLIGATNLIPGPNSTEMTMHCGHERAGFKGLFVAGASFIFPAIIITGILAWLYVTYGKVPEVKPFIYGITPAVLAIIASAIYKLGKKALKNWELGVLGFLVLGLSLFGIHEIIALLGAGLVGAIYFNTKEQYKNPSDSKSALTLLTIPLVSGTVSKLTTLGVFWTFLKVGSVLYGSGYVLFAYLDVELVDAGYLTRHQLLDAIGVGQFTPGPVLSTATFIGYQLQGLGGALAATAGIFLPSFIFVLIMNPFVPKMRKSKFLGFFLDSVNIAAVAVMLGVLFTMSMETITNWRAIVIALISFGIIFGFKRVSVMWTVFGGALLGYVMNFINF